MNDEARREELRRREDRAACLLSAVIGLGAVLALLAIGGLLVEGAQHLGAALP